jgi:hypothetical protein
MQGHIQTNFNNLKQTFLLKIWRDLAPSWNVAWVTRGWSANQTVNFVHFRRASTYATRRMTVQKKELCPWLGCTEKYSATRIGYPSAIDGYWRKSLMACRYSSIKKGCIVLGSMCLS